MKNFINNLFSSSIFILVIIYFIINLFMYYVFGTKNESHALDIMIYPVIALLWLLLNTYSNKIIIYLNIVTFIVILSLSVVFYIDIFNDDNSKYEISNKKVTSIIENDMMYYINIDDTLNYYILKNDTNIINYDWKVYNFIRIDMFNDTLYGSYYLGNDKKYLHLYFIR